MSRTMQQTQKAVLHPAGFEKKTDRL